MFSYLLKVKAGLYISINTKAFEIKSYADNRLTSKTFGIQIWTFWFKYSPTDSPGIPVGGSVLLCYANFNMYVNQSHISIFYKVIIVLNLPRAWDTSGSTESSAPSY